VPTPTAASPPKAVSPKPPAKKPARRARADDDDDAPRGLRGRINQVASSKWGRRVVVPLGVLAIGYLLYDQISGPSLSDAVARGNAAGYPVSHKLTAEEYQTAFAKNPKDAAAKFHEDVYVELSGKVRKVLSDPKKAVVLLETPSATQAVECQFTTREEIEGLKAGDQVTVQGEAHAPPAKGGEKENVKLGMCKLRR
jgi:hypothetical protein